MAVALQSHTCFDSAPGLQPLISHHALPVYLLKAQVAHTHIETHTYSLPCMANFSWVAAKIKAFIHPRRLEVKRGADRRSGRRGLEYERHAGVGSDCVLSASG